MTMGEPEPGRKPVCEVCGGVDGYHDTGCSMPIVHPMPSICLAIPHTPWKEERKRNMAVVRRTLELNVRPAHYHELTDVAPNAEWSVTMWKWMLETKADFCLTLQDDVNVAPFFWFALQAMLTKLPRRHILGLSCVHPAARVVAKRGHRWMRTTSWVVGWAYGMWREDLREFLDWRLTESGCKFTEDIAPNGEDAVLNHWIGMTGRDTWHPVPTIVDHDTSLDSNYADNVSHGHRRPHVTWRTYLEAELCDPDFWLVNGKEPQHYHTVAQELCWWCGERRAVCGSEVTGAMLCALCVGQTAGALLARVQG